MGFVCAFAMSVEVSRYLAYRNAYLRPLECISMNMFSIARTFKLPCCQLTLFSLFGRFFFLELWGVFSLFLFEIAIGCVRERIRAP